MSKEKPLQKNNTKTSKIPNSKEQQKKHSSVLSQQPNSFGEDVTDITTEIVTETLIDNTLTFLSDAGSDIGSVLGDIVSGIIDS